MPFANHHATLERGLAEHRAGRLAGAEAAYRQVLAQAPRHARALHLLGMLHLDRRDPAGAAGFLADSLSVDPKNVAARIQHGNALWELGRRDEALGAFARAIEQQPGDAKLLLHVARLQQLAGHAGNSRKLLERALAIAPENPDVQLAVANHLRISGQPDDAASHYERVVAARPGDAGAWFGLGECRRLANRMDSARDAFQKAISIRHLFPEALNNLAVVCCALGRHEEALTHATQALAAKPDYPDALGNQGVALNALGRHDEARVCHERALALDPANAIAHGNLANALFAMGRMDDAVKAYRAALAIKPDFIDARWGLTTVLLLQGKFAEGWPELEWRWKTDNRYLRRCFTQPWWQNEPVSDRHLLVWGEQGIGDEVLYASLMPDLIGRARRLTLECAPRLVPLFARSFPDVTVVARGDPPDARALEADMQSPLASTAHWMRRRWDDFPRHGGYLRAAPELVNALRDRYRRLGAGPLIGLSWRSGNAKVGAARSIALSALAPAITATDAVFVNLQYGDCRAEVAARRDVRVHTDTAVDTYNDLDAFAAQVAAMDVVITIDNVTAHFAGALGRPAWVLLPAGRGLHWYWFLDRDTSPWYPSARLFRQDRPGDWSSVVKDLAAALAE